MSDFEVRHGRTGVVREKPVKLTVYVSLEALVHLNRMVQAVNAQRAEKGNNNRINLGDAASRMVDSTVEELGSVTSDQKSQVWAAYKLGHIR